MAANWELGHLSPQSDAHSTLLGQVLRGLGIGFLFIPVSVTAYSTLKGAQIAQGTALWNLSLQLGGSFGIAALNTYVINMTQFHRVGLVSYLVGRLLRCPTGRRVWRRLFRPTDYGAASAHSAALGVIEQTVQAQAQTMAYNDAFLLIGAAFAFAFPVILLLKRPETGRSACRHALKSPQALDRAAISSYNAQMKCFLGALALALVCGVALAQAGAPLPLVPRYEKFEAAWTLPSQSGNPFDPHDNDVEVIFHGPAGLRAVVPAFWDGDRWRVRYAPTHTGAYILTVLRNGQAVHPADLTSQITSNASPALILDLSGAIPKSFRNLSWITGSRFTPSA